MNDFRPGLEGVIAFETEIAEPDKEGSALRYRGVDIEELVGHYPFEQVWGLLVDGSFEPGMPKAERIELQDPSGSVMADLQAALATLGSKWSLRQLVDIEAEQARDDLARLSAATLSIVAQSARGDQPPVPESEIEQGENAAAQFLIRWRGEADPRHVEAVDTYWVSAAEHGLNSSTFTARIVASTGADCAAAMSSAVGALSGPLHGGAPTRVLKMLDEVEARGDAEAYVHDMLDRGERIMGFGHRVYRAEDPRARVLRRTARKLGSKRVEVAEALEEAARAALRETVARPRAGDERRVLGRRRARARRHPARDVPADVRLRARRRLVGAHHRAAPHRPADPPVGALRRAALAPRGRDGLSAAPATLADAAAEANAFAEQGSERELADLRAEWGEELEMTARSADYRERVVAYRAIGQFRFRAEDRADPPRPRGREPGLPRLGAALARAALARPPRRRERDAAAAARAGDARRQPGGAAARDHGAPQRLGQRETIAILAALGNDDEQDRELREAAAKVAQQLRKKAGPAK